MPVLMDVTNEQTAANLASTSTTGIPVLMDVTNEQTIDISIGSATELRDLNISRSEAMQNHWRSADKRFKTVFEANPFGLSCSVCDRLWFERDLKKCLADFVAWYTPVTKKGRPLGTEVNDNASGDDEPAPYNVPYESTSTIGSAYRKRSAPRVIRYRGYELNDVVNYKREMVTLYLPFKNEAVEILDRNGFLRMYDEREAEIMAKRKEFESNIDIAKILDEMKKICEDFDNVDPLDTSNSRDDFVRNVLGLDDTENNDDFENAVNTIGILAVRKRSNVTRVLPHDAQHK
ncbi:uncharacterized protein TNCV_3360121 [Trichonephila clavipes]|nr:uncharacterized protein TNCV_3360121 [Trichonephila clavipes]